MFGAESESLVRIVVVGIMAYVAMVVMLRLSGNRTLSKMNSFDLVVTVAFGSTLSSLLIDDSIKLAEGVVAIALLVLLQFFITWLSVRSRHVSQMVKTRPTLLLRDGQVRIDALKRVRVTEEEVRAAVRQHGLGELRQAAAVTLESDGSLSVISIDARGSLDTLAGVRGEDN